MADVTVGDIQTAAAAAANTYAAQVTSLSNQLQGLGNALAFENLVGPGDMTIEPYDHTALNALMAATQQALDLKPVDMKDYPEKPGALGTFTAPAAAQYHAPNTVDELSTDGRPGAADLPAVFTQDVPVLVPLETIAFSPLDVITVPDAPTAQIFTYPDVQYVTLPDFDVGTAPLSDIPASSFLLDNHFDWVEEDYTSQLLDELNTQLLDNLLNGGYGINPSDEQPLWERAREREMLAGETAIEQATAQAAARGFTIPPGALMALIEGAQQAALEKISSASREIALKRADMYVENRKFTIQQSKEVEQMLITYWGYKQERALKAAQAVVEIGINTYNAIANVFNIKVQSYKTAIDAYNARVVAALAPYERDKIMLELTKTKASVYATVVQAYEGVIRGATARVEMNKARLEQDKLRFDFEKVKLEKYLAEVQGFKALIDAKTAEYQGYSAKWDGYKSQVQGYVAEVSAYNARVDAAAKEFQTQAETVKNTYEIRKLELAGKAAEADAYSTTVQGVASENSGQLAAFRSRVEVISEQIRGLAAGANALGTYYKAAGDLVVQRGQVNSSFAVGYGQFIVGKANAMGTAYSHAMTGYSSAITGYANAASGIVAQISNV